jgi:uncharacterized protein (TIGR03437 family)
MSNRGRVKIWITVGVFAILVPLVVFAYEYGPNPRVTGAPGDDPLACSTVAQGQCHAGTAKGGPINVAGGSVNATFSSGTTYIPGGAAITITVSVTDPVNTHYGFQMTARPEGNLSQGQAGDFTPGANQLVICDNNTVKPVKGLCPVGSPVEFIEHDYPAGVHVGTTPYTFTWTPPATNVGNVHFYVAGNAVNNNLQADAGDHVYTNSYVLTPALPPFNCTNTTPPVITSIDSASGYGGYAYFASGTWLEIKGSNLADPADPRLTTATNPGQWTAADFNGSSAPTSLDGISVSINGKPAYVWFLSTGQLNVQAPEDTTTGNVAITVTNCNATSSPVMFARRALAPGFLAPTNYTANGTQYAVATFQSDGAYVLNTATGASFGLTSRPAKPGDGIILYGIGFGDVTNAPFLPGVIVGGANTLVNPVTISFGSANASIVYQGLAGGFVGLYEFYITVPTGLANGDYQIKVTQNGTAVPQTMSLTVHN